MSARRHHDPGLLAGAAWGSLVAVVSASAVVLAVVAQDAVLSPGGPDPGPDAGLVVLTLGVAAVGAAVVGAVIGVLAALAVRRSGVRGTRARIVVTAFPVVVVAGVVAITRGAACSVWLWAMVPVAALAGLVLARRLAPVDGAGRERRGTGGLQATRDAYATVLSR